MRGLMGAGLAAIAFGWAAAAAVAADDLSANMRVLERVPLSAEAADMAFWGDRAVVSLIGDGDANDGFALFDLADPAAPRLLSEFRCSTSHFDISIWGDLVLLADNYQHETDACSEPGMAFGDGFAGIRLVSIADPRKPAIVANVDGGCTGAHTLTVIPDLERNRLVIWLNNGGGPQIYNIEGAGCDSIVEVPLADPSKARRIADVPLGGPLSTCHDVTINTARNLAAASCLTDVRIFSIADPAAPVLLSATVIPGTTILHNASFSADGNTLAVSDEQLPGQAGFGGFGGCFGETIDRIGAVYFLDVSNPHLPPIEQGHFQVPRSAEGYCTAHEHNVVPLRSDGNILVSAWYERGVSVIDFSDPSAPKEIAHAVPEGAQYWAAYWYNGLIYGSSFGEHSFDVLALDDPAVADWVRTTRLDAQTNEPLSAIEAHLALGAVVRPAALRAGRRSRLTVTVTQTDGLTTRPAARALVTVAGRRARTDARGRAILNVKPRRTGKLKLTVSKDGYPAAAQSLRVR